MLPTYIIFVLNAALTIGKDMPILLQEETSYYYFTSLKRLNTRYTNILIAWKPLHMLRYVLAFDYTINST